MASNTPREDVITENGTHISFPPCQNTCHHPALLLWQRACRHSWPRPESWLPLSLEPPLSSGWRRSRNTPRCSGGSAHRSPLQRRPESAQTTHYENVSYGNCDCTCTLYTFCRQENISSIQASSMTSMNNSFYGRTSENQSIRCRGKLTYYFWRSNNIFFLVCLSAINTLHWHWS